MGWDLMGGWQNDAETQNAPVLTESTTDSCCGFSMFSSGKLVIVALRRVCRVNRAKFLCQQRRRIQLARESSRSSDFTPETCMIHHREILNSEGLLFLVSPQNPDHCTLSLPI